MGENIMIMTLWLTAFAILIMAEARCLNYDILYPKEPSIAAAIYVQAPFVIELEEFTICYRFITNAKIVSVFSYAVPDSSNEVLIELDGDTLNLYIGNIVGKLPLQRKMNEWTHHCVIFESDSGLMELYRDGTIIGSSSKNSFQGVKVKRDGLIVLGQDQDKFGGDFEPYSSMRGRLTDVQVWDRILTPTQVAAVAAGKSKGGNVIAWSMVRSKWRVQDGAKTVDSQCTEE